MQVAVEERRQVILRCSVAGASGVLPVGLLASSSDERGQLGGLDRERVTPAVGEKRAELTRSLR